MVLSSFDINETKRKLSLLDLTEQGEKTKVERRENTGWLREQRSSHNAPGGKSVTSRLRFVCVSFNFSQKQTFQSLM